MLAYSDGGCEVPGEGREGKGGRVRGDTGQLVDQPTDCLVYNRRVQVLPSRVKRKPVCVGSSWGGTGQTIS